MNCHCWLTNQTIHRALAPQILCGWDWGGGSLSTHDIGGSYQFPGTLRSDQAPQFALLDGSRVFTGTSFLVDRRQLMGLTCRCMLRMPMPIMRRRQRALLSHCLDSRLVWRMARHNIRYPLLARRLSLLYTPRSLLLLGLAGVFHSV